MVDLLGHAGHLQEAEDMIKMMPCKPDVAVWMALLGACRIHGHVEMGERIAKHILEVDPGNAAGYVLLSNIYAAAGKWDLSEKVQSQRKEMGVKKQPGRTWIEVNNEVHTFVVDDQDHPPIIEIRAELKRLYRQMQEAGYVPDTKLCYMMWRKKKRCIICVTIVRNWQLHLGSSAHLLVLQSGFSRISEYVGTATLPPSSLQK
jgi:hypothetical protein